MYGVLATVLLLFAIITIIILSVKSGYANKFLFKMGLRQKANAIDWTALAWESSLRKMNCRADVVVFGDSIARGSDFHLEFPDYEIINLGCTGDTPMSMYRRVPAVQALNPNKVFVMVGINGLSNYNLSLCAAAYDRLIERIRELLPEAEIFIHSVLPISKKREKKLCKNKTIVKFNEKIKNIASEKGVIYIDLYSLYVLDGAINPDYVQKDGLHLLPDAYKLWYNTLSCYLSDTIKT